jgi:penicillin amidase
VPEGAWPEALDPARGFVLTANNDIAGTTLDGDVENDPYYIGAAYDTGFRARTIHDELERLTATGNADAAAMAALQASHTSVTAGVFLPELEAALDAAAAAIAVPMATRTPEEARLALLYEPSRARIDEAMARLVTWRDGGAHTASGVETFYDTIDGTESDDSVATMIWAETFRRLQARILDDEGISEVLALDPRRLRGNLLRRLFEGRGAANPMALASWDAATEEPAYFDDRTTAGVVERSEESLVGAIRDAVAALEAAPDAMGGGGFGSTDMNTWNWGLRHQVRFESIVIVYAGSAIPMADLLLGRFAISTGRLPLAASFPTGDPRRDLEWFPRPGDFYDVDAATPSFAVGDSYTYAYGPVMRFAVELSGGRVSGRNVIPGGESGVTDSEHFDDQAALWLGNTTVPLRFHVEDVVEGAVSRETFRPAP